jgi:hypothetical protein
MANGILNPNDFTIAPNDMRSLEDRMLEYRQSLPPSLQGAAVESQPQQTQQQQTQQTLAERINQAAVALAQQSVQQQSQASGAKPKAKDVQTQLDEFQSTIDQLNPLKAQQRMGSGTLGQVITGSDKGGILGTGVQPVDILAFTLGAALAPKGSSVYRRAGIALKVGMLPSQFRNFQEQKIKEFAQAQLHGINAEVGVANSEVAQANAIRAQQQLNEGNKMADAFDMAGESGKAMAIRANRVADYEKLTGDTSKAPSSLMQHIEGIASGAQPAPQWFLQMTGSKSATEAQAAATAWMGAHMMNQPPIPTPTGAVYRTPSGLQDVGAGTQGIQDIRRNLELQRRGVTPQPQPSSGVPMAAPRAPMAPSAPAGIAQPAEPAMIDPAQIVIQLQKSPNEVDQRTFDYYNGASPQTQRSLVPLFQKPLDASVRQKLVAQKAAIEYSEDLLNKYNSMVKSYGGEGQFKFTDQMKQWMVTQGSRISGEGLSGAVLSTAADLARRGAQEFGRPFTPEAHDFMAMYNQAQKFARGAMNDAANLATRERDMFAGMLGKPLDKPAFFRATLLSFHDEIAREYNDNLAANKLNRLEGLAPVVPLRGSKPAPTWFKPLNQEQTQAPVTIPPGGEY